MLLRRLYSLPGLVGMMNVRLQPDESSLWQF